MMRRKFQGNLDTADTKLSQTHLKVLSFSVHDKTRNMDRISSYLHKRVEICRAFKRRV
jgi:hypothetical protein